MAKPMLQAELTRTTLSKYCDRCQHACAIIRLESRFPGGHRRLDARLSAAQLPVPARRVVGGPGFQVPFPYAAIRPFRSQLTSLTALPQRRLYLLLLGQLLGQSVVGGRHTLRLLRDPQFQTAVHHTRRSFGGATLTQENGCPHTNPTPQHPIEQRRTHFDARRRQGETGPK